MKMKVVQTRLDRALTLTIHTLARMVLLGLSLLTVSHAQNPAPISDGDACQTVKTTIPTAAHLFLNRTNPAKGESENQRFSITSVTMTPTGISFSLKYAKDLILPYSDIAATMDSSKAYNAGRVWIFYQKNNWYLEFRSPNEGSASSGIASLISRPDPKTVAMDKALTHFSVALYHLVDLAHSEHPYDCSAPTMMQSSAPVATASVATPPVVAPGGTPAAPATAPTAAGTNQAPASKPASAVPQASVPTKPLPSLDDFKKQTAAWRARSVKPALSDEVKKKKLLAEDAIDHKNPRAAIAYYEAGLAIDSTWAQGWYSVALLYADQQDYLHASFSMKHYLILLPKAPNLAAIKDKELLWEAKAEEATQK